MQILQNSTTVEMFSWGIPVSSLEFLLSYSDIFLNRRGIAPTRDCTHLLKNVLYLFVCILWYCIQSEISTEKKTLRVSKKWHLRIFKTYWIIISKTVFNFSIAEHLGIDKKLPVEEIIEKLQVKYFLLLILFLFGFNVQQDIKGEKFVCVCGVNC